MELGRIVSMISALAREATESELFHMLTACSSILQERKDEEQREKNKEAEERRRQARYTSTAIPNYELPAVGSPMLPPRTTGTWDLYLMDSIKTRHPSLEMEWIQTAMDYTFMNNMKISAIKFIRTKTNLGLKEAKDIVDSMCSMHQDYMVKQNKIT